ncbi:PREDICTED: uncharacterized protein LOC109187400 [Ipomoea nil]|uniref:uncharacterized protein LOC109187400 n=1 Tax=Ipomoea nil TaxID=35883 RepID=UPI0009018A22|nr:PREDICTED: uncharacterized protein LOC109187400 [Ipomoea nil]
MAAEQQHYPTLLHLFDSLWFEHQILTSKNPTLISSNSNPTPQEDVENPKKLSRTPTFISRSFSDQCLSSKDSLDSEVPSPKSVLLESSKLQPILSGKEYIGISEQGEMKDAGGSFTGVSFKNRESCRRRRRRKDGSGNSKSLSELEFKELKGFMDLGFVFSDEDRDSTLVSIIPGLQRLGREGVEEEGEKKGIAVSRPYLSEAWDVMGENRKNQNPLVNWRIPDFGNEMDMKNHLRFWAHTVASNAR